VQLFDGYGESMIDYDHRQTTIGAGFLVTDWFQFPLMLRFIRCLKRF
jgi:hypothetical protein